MPELAMPPSAQWLMTAKQLHQGGERVKVKRGGKPDPRSAERRLDLEGEIRLISDGFYTGAGPMWEDCISARQWSCGSVATTFWW